MIYFLLSIIAIQSVTIFLFTKFMLNNFRIMIEDFYEILDDLESEE